MMTNELCLSYKSMKIVCVFDNDILSSNFIPQKVFFQANSNRHNLLLAVLK